MTDEMVSSTERFLTDVTAEETFVQVYHCMMLVQLIASMEALIAQHACWPTLGRLSLLFVLGREMICCRCILSTAV